MENIEINVESGVKEVTIRHGDAPKVELPQAFKIETCFTGIVDYLRGQWHEVNEQTIILISIATMSMKLIMNTLWNKNEITAKLQLNPDLAKFKINSESTWVNSELAKFLRFYRNYFESKEIANNLINVLQNFKAKINKEIEKTRDDKGNYDDVKRQVVDSNTPKSFRLFMPVFKNDDSIALTVEVFVNDDLSINLIVPDLQEEIDNRFDYLLKVQLNLLSELEKANNKEITKIQI